MMKYRIEIKQGKHPLPVAVMEDRKYELAGEFLLAEARSFDREILAALNQVVLDGKPASSFVGNAFSLEIAPKRTKICHDISDRECEVETGEFKKLVEDYLGACE